MMARATVPDAMSAAFGAAAGDLAERLMTALEGAEAEGGDVRGRQSAALLVAPAQGEPWQARIDLRVEDHADPIGELRRLLGLQRAYELAGEADELMGEGRADEAAGALRARGRARARLRRAAVLGRASRSRRAATSRPAPTPSGARPRSTRAGSRCSTASRRSSRRRARRCGGSSPASGARATRHS